MDNLTVAYAVGSGRQALLLRLTVWYLYTKICGNMSDTPKSHHVSENSISMPLVIPNKLIPLSNPNCSKHTQEADYT